MNHWNTVEINILVTAMLQVTIGGTSTGNKYINKGKSKSQSIKFMDSFIKPMLGLSIDEKNRLMRPYSNGMVQIMDLNGESMDWAKLMINNCSRNEMVAKIKEYYGWFGCVIITSDKTLIERIDNLVGTKKAIFRNLNTVKISFQHLYNCPKNDGLTVLGIECKKTISISLLAFQMRMRENINCKICSICYSYKPGLFLSDFIEELKQYDFTLYITTDLQLEKLCYEYKLKYPQRQSHRAEVLIQAKHSCGLDRYVSLNTLRSGRQCACQRKSLKVWKTRQGSSIVYQGYEKGLLKLLDHNLIEESQIVNAKTLVPKFQYFMNGKKHVYTPDAIVYKRILSHIEQMKYIQII